MKTHNIRLTSRPFATIASGQKTIESRLYDEKRKQIAVGDTIIFTNRENESQTIKVEVIGLLCYVTFNDLFTHNDPTKFGGPDSKWLLNQIHEFYSEADEIATGVVGIEFELI